MHGTGATNTILVKPGAATDAWNPTLAIFGDMGISSNAQDTLVWLLKDLDDGAIDFVAHIGDQVGGIFVAQICNPVFVCRVDAAQL